MDSGGFAVARRSLISATILIRLERNWTVLLLLLLLSRSVSITTRRPAPVGLLSTPTMTQMDLTQPANLASAAALNPVSETSRMWRLQGSTRD